MKKTAKIIVILASLCLLAAIFVVVGVAAETPVEGTWVVDGVGYDDLDDALVAAGGTQTKKGSKTVKLNKDVTVEEIINTESNATYKDKGYYVVQYSGRIDMNGHTITSSSNNNNCVFYPWYSGMSFEIVGEGKFLGVNSVIATTPNSTFLIEGRGSGIEIVFNEKHNSNTYVFDVSKSKNVTVKGNIIITPFTDAAGYVFKIGDGTSTADVSLETARTLTFDGARVTVNIPTDDSAAVSTQASLYLVCAYDNSATVVKNHSYIDLKHGNFFTVASGTTSATLVEEFSYTTFKLLSYRPKANTDYTPKIWVDIDDSVVHAYESNVKRVYNDGSSGKLFALRASKALVTVDNSELGGACRAMGATYGFNAYKDSTSLTDANKLTEAEYKALTDKTQSYFTANVPASKFIFNNVDYIGDMGSTYGSSWLFTDGANVKWTGGYIKNRNTSYSGVLKTITVLTSEDTVKDLESWKALCVKNGLDANIDYYYTKTVKDGNTSYAVRTKSSNYDYSVLSGDIFAYSEFTKSEDGSYAPTAEGEKADEWFGAYFGNIYIACQPSENGYNAWPRIQAKFLDGELYTNVTVYDENRLDTVVYPYAYLTSEPDPFTEPEYWNVYNPTTEGTVSAAGLELVPRQYGTFTPVLSVGGSNGYLKFVTGSNKTTTASYLGLKIHKEYIKGGTYKIGGGITLNSAGSTATKYNYIVQQFDLATEGGTYASGRFQFVVRAVNRASYTTSAAVGAIQNSIAPIEIKKDGTLAFDTSKAWAVHKNSGKTAKLSTDPFDWSRITVIYEIPGTYQNSTPVTTYYAYVGDVSDLTLGEDGKYTDSDGVVYEHYDNGSYYNTKTSNAIAKSEAGKEHLPAFISDAEGNIYTYMGSYTYTHTPEEGEAKTIKINANLTSETEYFVTYMMDTKGEIYTYTVNEGAGVYLDSNGEAYDAAADGKLISAKIVVANSASNVYVRSYYRRAITRDTGLLDVYAHIYINGEWFITYTDFFNALDVDALDSLLLDQLRFNLLNGDNHVTGSDILFDNAMVKYYKKGEDCSEIKAAVDNLDKPLSGRAFTMAPDNNYWYNEVVGTVDGEEYKSEEALLGAIEEGSFVESYIDFSDVITPDKSFTVRFSEGKSAKGFISDEYAVFDNGSIVNVSPAYTDEIFDVTFSAEKLGIENVVEKAAYGTLSNIPEEYTPENFANILVGDKVYELLNWTKDESLSKIDTLVIGNTTLYAVVAESAPAIIEWYDQDGNLIASEKSVYGTNVVAKDSEALRAAAYRKLSNGMYDYGFAAWDNDLATTYITESGTTYKFTATVKGVLPEDGVSVISINVAIYTDFELNIYIPSSVEGVSDIVVYSDADLTTPLGTRGEEGLTVGGVPHVKYYAYYGVADTDIDTYYISYKAAGGDVVYAIEYGIPYYVSAIMQKSDAEVGVKAKSLVMSMVNYADKIMAHGGVDRTTEGGQIYTKLLEKFGVDSEYEYLSVYEGMNAEMFTDTNGTIYKEQIANLTYKQKLSGYIKSAGFYFSTEAPAFIFEYGDKAVQHAEGIKAPTSNGFYSHNSVGVFTYFGYGSESQNPIKHLAYAGGIQNGTQVNDFGMAGTVRTFSDTAGNKYTLNLETGKYYAVEGGAEYTGEAELTPDVSYYAYCSSYRYNEDVPDGYHYIYNLLKPVAINVSVGHTNPETNKFDHVSSLAGGTYSFAAYVLSLIETNNTDYLDLAYSLYAYSMVASDYKGN